MNKASELIRSQRDQVRSGTSGTLFGVVIGLFLGVLLAAIVLPTRDDGDGSVTARGGQAAGAPQTTATTIGDPGAPGPVDSGVAPTPTAGGGQGAATGEDVSSLPGPVTEDESAAAEGQSYLGDNFPVVTENGVADDSITIGIALLDTTVLGPVADQGRPEDFYDARLAAWKRDGLLPIHGRDVKFEYRRYNVLDNSDQRASCQHLVKDRKVFMVLATVFYRVGEPCVARENQVPFLTSDATNETALARSHPYSFAIAMSDDRVMRNLAHWAHATKQLSGKIGIYWNNSDPLEADLVEKFKAELNGLDYKVAAEATTDTDDSSQNDLLAVRRFQQAGVEVVFLFASREGFTLAAQQQDYKPKYVESDHAYGTTESSTASVPEEQYVGTQAITGRRGGENAAGYPYTPEQTKCMDDFVAHTGERPQNDSFQWQMLMHSCDAANSILLTLQRIGPNVTHESFIAGMETLQNVRMARSGHTTFGPNKHHGVDFYRTVEWRPGSECESGNPCWKAIDDFKPLFVP